MGVTSWCWSTESGAVPLPMLPAQVVQTWLNWHKRRWQIALLKLRQGCGRCRVLGLVRGGCCSSGLLGAVDRLAVLAAVRMEGLAIEDGLRDGRKGLEGQFSG